MNGLQGLLYMLAGAVIREAITDYRDQRKRGRTSSAGTEQAPLNAILLCSKCQRRASRQCPRHKAPMCGRCRCPECDAIRDRLKAGTPRTPQNYQPPSPARPVGQAVPVARPAGHDPRWCKCPYCVKFDGPNANDPEVGMK
jgi:hypothetical protein